LTATADVLELLTRLIKTTNEAEAGQLQIVPVLISDLAAYQGLIESAVESAGGQVFLASDLADGVTGTLRAGLKEVVVTGLNVLQPGGGRLDLAVTEDGGIVRATIRGQGAGGASPGIRTILGLASVLFDRRMDQIPFAVIVYSESSLDDDLADAAWRLYTSMLDNISVGRLRTLFLLIEGARVKYDRHCTGETSLFGRLGENGAEFRKSWNTSRAGIHLLRPDAERVLVLFLGAGFSASSGLPLGNGLRDAALTRLMQSSEPYEATARQFRQYLSSNERLFPREQTMSITEFVKDLTLERVLREEIYYFRAQESPTLVEFQRLNEGALASPGRGVRALRRMIVNGRRLVIVTVNFDTLVESVEDDRVRVFASDEEFGECEEYLDKYVTTGGKTPLLKLHGTIDRLETIVATVDETARGLATAKERSLRKLIHLNSPSPMRWVYVGYSMRDPDVTRVLGTREFGEQIEEAWVSPFPVQSARQFAEQSRIFEGRPDFWHRSVTESADVFLEELERAW
jgi:hypothetical protein